jgi:hypothetical protein
MNHRRDPLDKEKFLEGNRQRWAVIFLLCGAGVLVSNIILPSLDPVPYMQFLMAIGSLFILGASASDWVKTYQVTSVRNTQIKEETKREVIKNGNEPDKRVSIKFAEEHKADESYAPQEWISEQSDDG